MRPFKRATQERAKRNNLQAGEYFTIAGYRTLGKEPLYPSSGGELKHFLEAATCYLVGGQRDRAVNRCKTGILRAEELHERAMNQPEPELDIHKANRGTWKEVIGIFRQVGDISGSDDAYAQAFDIYESAGDPSSHRAEPPKTPIYTWFRALEMGAIDQSRGVEFQRSKTYTQYGKYMREHIPEYLDTVTKQGEWTP